MRTMIDSTTAADALAQPAQLYGGYSDGIYADLGALRASAPPGAVIVEYSAVGTDSGTVGDVEYGCIPIAAAPGWVVMRRAAGIDPTVYCSRSNWPAVIAAFTNAGVAEPHWDTAHYTNAAHLCSSGCYPSGVGDRVAVATQYGGDLSGHYDISCVADYWPGIDTADTTAGSSSTPLEDDLTPDESAWLKSIFDTMQVGPGLPSLGQTIVDIRGDTASTLATLQVGPGLTSIGQTIVDIRADTASLARMIGDPASGALVRLANLKSAVDALPAGTTADSPAAVQALADIHTLATELTALGQKLGAAA